MMKPSIKKPPIQGHITSHVFPDANAICYTFVRNRDNKELGIVNIAFMPAEVRVPHFDYYVFGLRADIHNRGIGSALMRHVMATYADRSIALHAFSRQASQMGRLTAFYRQFGFEQVADVDEHGRIFMISRFKEVEPCDLCLSSSI